jgi:hypothetical protein
MNPRQPHDGKKARPIKKNIACSHPLHPPTSVVYHPVQYLHHRIISPIRPIDIVDCRVCSLTPPNHALHCTPKHLLTRRRNLFAPRSAEVFAFAGFPPPSPCSHSFHSTHKSLGHFDRHTSVKLHSILTKSPIGVLDSNVTIHR